MKKSILRVLIILATAIFLPSTAFAATACSTVKIEIAQELTLDPAFTNISDISGSGVVNAGETGIVHWLIIPSTGAGGTAPFRPPY
ncbi:MAG TPA: hypothetical protein VGK71_01370 [Nitrospirota bacterium]|jgi:hypothetical protein